MLIIAANILYIKIDDEDEVASNEITSHFTFLGLSEAPNLLHNYRDDTMQDGNIWNYSRYGQTTVTARFLLQWIDRRDYKLAKHEIYRIFGQKGIFRLRTGVEPDIVRYCRPGAFNIDVSPEDPDYCVIEIPFDNPSGLRFSRLHTDKMAEKEFLSLNMNLPVKKLQYHFTGQTSFSVYNAGDITVDPETQNHDLKITMKHNGGKFTVKNKTTNTSWTYNKNLGSGDTLILNGINTYKNDELDSVNTDYGYLTLKPGINNIEVSGASDLDITFSFPYMYLG